MYYFLPSIRKVPYATVKQQWTFVHSVNICNKARTKNFADVQDHYIMHLIMLVPSNTL